MHRLANQISAVGGTGILRNSRARMALVAGFGAVTLVIGGATLFPSRNGELAAHPAALAVRYQSSPRPRDASGYEERTVTERFTGRVGANLTDSLRSAGVPELQGREYVSLLSRAIVLRDGLSVDDRFDLILVRDPNTGKLGQLVYAGMDRVARADLELVKWTDGKHTIWVNADNIGSEQQAAIGLPVQGRVSSPFGERFHPILGYVRMHKGVDLAAAAGTPILAAADGKVIGAGWHGGYGRQVEIAHGSGLETSYGHMSRIAAHIGQVIRKGEVIGWVGSSGLSTGAHVHFEVTRDGKPVNPLTLNLNNGPRTLEGQNLKKFDDSLRTLLIGSVKTS